MATHTRVPEHRPVYTLHLTSFGSVLGEVHKALQVLSPCPEVLALRPTLPPSSCSPVHFTARRSLQWQTNVAVVTAAL